jgi:hypothetical protein
MPNNHTSNESDARIAQQEADAPLLPRVFFHVNRHPYKMEGEFNRPRAIGRRLEFTRRGEGGMNLGPKRCARALVPLALLLVSARSVSANVLNEADAKDVSSLGRRALALARDMWGPNFALQSVDMSGCAQDLSGNLDTFFYRLHPVIWLVRLAPVMEDSRDEQQVISALSIAAKGFLEEFEYTRRGFDAIAGRCPRNSTVATAVEKIQRLYSDTTSAVQRVIKKIGTQSAGGTKTTPDPR